MGSSVSKVDVHLSVNKNPSVSENHNAEVTVFAKNHVIRATDTWYETLYIIRTYRCAPTPQMLRCSRAL